MRTLPALVAATLLLVACEKPVPPERAAYVGHWSGGPIRQLDITQAGRIEYLRAMEGGGTTTISSPIQRFEGDDFVVGVGPISTTFKVTAPPHQDATGMWVMTVDGVEVRRSGGDGNV